MKSLIALLLCLCLLPLSSLAETYRIVHPDGTVEFTDKPVDGAQPIEIRELNTYSAPPPPALSPVTSPEEEEPATKPNISIVAPADGAEMESPEEGLVARAMVRPRMHEGWRIVFTLDGGTVKSDGGPIADLGQLGYGEHTLEARILNSSGRRLARAEAVRFTITRPARVKDPAPLPGAPSSPVPGQLPNLQQYSR